MIFSPFHSPSRVALTLFIGISLACVIPRALGEEVVGEWDFNGAEIVNDSLCVRVIDGVAGDLFVKPTSGMADSGIKIEKKDGTSGPNVVAFEGYPVNGLTSKKPIKWEEGQDFRIEVEVNPAGTSGGYVVRSFCNFALQYDPKTNNISLIVWLNDGHAESVGMKIGADKWNMVSAQLSNGEMAISVNGETQTKILPSGSVLAKTTNQFLVAYGFTNADHSFGGKIAKLRLSKLP